MIIISVVKKVISHTSAAAYTRYFISQVTRLNAEY